MQMLCMRKSGISSRCKQEIGRCSASRHFCRGHPSAVISTAPRLSLTHGSQHGIKAVSELRRVQHRSHPRHIACRAVGGKVANAEQNEDAEKKAQELEQKGLELPPLEDPVVKSNQEIKVKKKRRGRKKAAAVEQTDMSTLSGDEQAAEVVKKETKKGGRSKAVAVELTSLEPGLANEPLSSGESAGGMNSARAAEAAKQLESFRMAHKERFDVEPPPRLCKRFNGMRDKGRLSSRLDEWVAAFGKVTTKRVLHRRPEFLTFDVAAAKIRLLQSCALHGWSHEEGVLAMGRDPDFLQCSIERQTEWRSQVVSKLGCPEAKLGQWILENPTILYYSPENMAAKVPSLTTAFSGTGITGHDLVFAFPRILDFSEESLVAKVSSFVSALSPYVSWDPRQIFIAKPHLLCWNTEILDNKLSILMSACQKDPEWMEAWHKLKPSSIAASLSKSEKQLSRLLFYQSGPQAKKYAFTTLLFMTEDKFTNLYPDFEEWWQKQLVQKVERHL